MEIDPETEKRWKMLTRASRFYGDFMESVIGHDEIKTLDLLKEYGEGVTLAEVVPSGNGGKEIFLNPEKTEWKIIWSMDAPNVFREQVFYKKPDDMNVYTKSDKLVMLGSEKLDDYLQ